MVLLITGTVNPDSQVTNLFLKDGSERLRQYKETIAWTIDNVNVNEIVFCDNSSCLRENFSEFEDRAKGNGKFFEYISFAGNRNMIVSKGKGYGEGEIIEYALQHSTLLSASNYFVKLTGRLKVWNINEMLYAMKDVMRINMFNAERVDTRLYGVPKNIYEKYFLHSYYKVNDKEGFYLEHAFTDVLKHTSVKSRNLVRFPRYEGVSGSTGKVYTINEVKCKCKDLLSICNKYGLKKSKVGK